MLLKLIQNEWMKLFNRISTYIMLGILVLGVSVTAIVIFFNQTESSELPSEEEWKSELQQSNVNLEANLDDMVGGFDNYYLRSFYENELAINNYRIEHNLSPHEETNVWSYIDINTALVSLIGVFVIIVGASIVAHEFNKGTIKLLLVRSVSRTQILASKFITTILFGLFLLAILFSLSFIVGSILFGFDGSSIHLSAIDGEVKERSRILFLGLSYLSSSVTLLMLTAFSFMISTIFRSETIAIALSVMFLFIGTNATSILALFTDWAKYSLFANTDLQVYFADGPMIEGMTLGFSIAVLVIYFVIFLYLAFIFFKKRDVSI
ncbi:ABC transporter permease [Ornithinibacillus halophilus]|uniref:ABC-2 type transport system permease protein n=1 Tax=Ornithinibacillus halophilus TaxID=930117 RepID=A0A1M5E0Z7_9BACI|nr:ABC transporter permease subunit [Ornithinibacillus halophilus]SHF72794.1 ABC-2 type transport system permease protein [Ornithinibacillus halophilus]